MRRKYKFSDSTLVLTDENVLCESAIGHVYHVNNDQDYFADLVSCTARSNGLTVLTRFVGDIDAKLETACRLCNQRKEIVGLDWSDIYLLLSPVPSVFGYYGYEESALLTRELIKASNIVPGKTLRITQYCMLSGEKIFVDPIMGTFDTLLSCRNDLPQRIIMDVSREFFDYFAKIAEQHLDAEPIDPELDPEHLKPLFDAIRVGDRQQVYKLISQPVDLNQMNGNGISALGLAALYQDLGIAELLLDSGADVNVKNPIGKTPLILATQTDNVKMLELLLARGADIAATSIRQENALMFAANYGSSQAVRFLKSQGLNSETKNVYGQTAAYFYHMNHQSQFR